ncbi:DUF916 domain-containing protein [Microbacterium lacus]|uniref:WxL protein peptidoglycan domain-containing protein n=1 Tax=Microbacterium lacus TaxID=415217 RepID=UPI00384B4378
MIQLAAGTRGFWAAMLAIGLVAAIPTASAAAANEMNLMPADDQSDTVSWAVRPADEAGPDGRSWIELELEPGQAATEHLAVRNLGKQDVTFSVTGADGYFTPSGRFNILPSSEESVDAGTWLTVAPTVTVPAGGTAVVAFQIEVPADATPGDHAAGIAASVLTEGSADGATVAVESRVGFRVMVRVAGELTPQLGVTASGTYFTDWNPLDPGTVQLSYTLENTGNVRIVAEATAENGHLVDGDGDGDGDGDTELLPGDRRSHQIRIPQVWPVGMVTVPVTVERSIVLPNGEVQPLEPVIRTVTLWAIPWPQLLIVAGFALITVALVWRGKRSTRRIEILVARAREEGRLSAGEND